MKPAFSILTCLILIMLLVPRANCQDTLWSRIYGHSGQGGVFDSDRGMCGVVTSDGGYAFGGVSYAFVGLLSEYWLVRTDANGDTLWTRHYGTTGFEEAHYVIQTADGGFALCGESRLQGSSYYDMYIVKTDSLGDTLWTGRFGSPTSNEKGWAIVQTPDSGYLAVGYGNSGSPAWGDVYIVRLDVNGNSLWTKTYGGTHPDIAYGVTMTPDDGFAITGIYAFDDFGYTNLWLLRTDADGDTLWTRKYSFAGGFSRGEDIVVTPDGGFVIAGNNWITYTDTQFLMMKTDSLGNTVWFKHYGGPNIEAAMSIAKTSDGGFVAAGKTDSYGAGSSDFYIVRTDANGDSLWTAVFGIDGIDYCHEVRIDQADNIIAFGQRHPYGSQDFDFWMLKISDGALADYGYITGVVKEQDDFTPIENVEISIYDSGDSLAGTDTTDASGEFDFTLQPDIYYATFSKSGYRDTTLAGLDVVADETTAIEVIMYPSGCDYVPGDANGDGSVLGSDVTYSVRYFKGLGPSPPDSCWNDSTASWLYSGADSNGNCAFTGSDVTFLVAYFKGNNPEILYCPQTPPLGIIQTRR